MSYSEFIDESNSDRDIYVGLISGGEFLDSVLIEGDRDSLIFLADLIREVANDQALDKVAISPDGPGNIYFDKNSKMGIYINRR